MDKKIFGVFAVMAIAGAFIFMPSKNRAGMPPPGDLRDAVAAPSEFDTKLPATDNLHSADYPVSKAVTSKVSGLTSLISKWLEVKEKMENAELALWSIENSDKRNNEQAFQDAMTALGECHKAAVALNAKAGQALSITPKSQDNVIAAKLLLSAISDMTADNDIPPPALQSIYNIGKISPELKKKTKPHNDLLFEILNELGKAGQKVMKFSGPLP